MRALVTGASGFAGTHLVRLLLAEGHEVYALHHKSSSPSLEESASLHWIEVDLRAKLRTSRAVKEASPHLVFHLAAQSSSAAAWRDPMGTIENNTSGQINLLEAIRQAQINPRILIVSSNEVYGSAPETDLPLKETAPLRPINPYAVSKAAQDHIAYQYFVSYGLNCIRVRPFAHTGPGQRDAFAISSFARQIAEAELERQEPVLHVGNLDVVRDYSDVRDIVRGYMLAALHGQPGEVYNLGSGRPTSLRQIVEILISKSTVPMNVQVDADRFRVGDIPISYCDASKAKAELGWEPVIPLEQTLTDVLDYWRAELKNLSPNSSEELDPALPFRSIR